ncbi:hypothetical protein QAD02_003931 [Eretmocerus hayati]|uniref:Uncharacterized protein n=1 Tax=Eretmocerus hayati TaxID=131215 RepID=A0ACC2NPX4_9HYME|nr:hypothetical protein QAD02_003931 [Eretmocerus hayati]
MGVDSKVEYLIVDTSAFIKNAALQEIGNKIITEPSVVNEITSKRQLRRLVVLPYDLEVKDADPDDIKFVTEFSKKTGDYPSLSATDIKVIALTYRYERERVGVDHLRKEPQVKKEIIDSSVQKPDEPINNLVGFYMPEGDDEDEESSDESDEDDGNMPVTDITKVELNIEKSSESLDPSTKVCEVIHENKLSNPNDSGSDYETAPSEDEEEAENNLDDLNKKFGKLHCNPEDFKLDCSDDLNIDDILKPVKSNLNGEDQAYDANLESEKSDEEKEESENSEQDGDVLEEDDNDGWITPRNITNMRKQMDSGVVKEKPAAVACLTMDYAMQNVLMQIGLNVASLDGKVIKQMRTFILRCYSCFKTTGVVTKIFCPTCGNKTLKKVSVSLDDEGRQKIHINFRKPLTAKGKKFSLPTFQGGKHACNPILFEDQPRPDQRPTKLGRARNDPLNEDYIAGVSPFVMRDVNSRAAMLGIKAGGPVKYWMRRNPNEPRKFKK